MSVFDVTKTSSATDNRQAVDTEGVALQGISSAARDEAFNVGGIANTVKFADDFSGGSAVKNEADGIALGGSGNKLQLGGVQVGGAVSGGITVNSSEGVEAVSKTFADTVKTFVAGRATDPNDAVNIKPATATDEAKPATGGGVEKIVMWGVGIILTIVAGLWLARRKKSA